MRRGKARVTARLSSAGAAALATSLIVCATASAHEGVAVRYGPPLDPVAVPSGAPSAIGTFGRPFTEPTIDGRRTNRTCIPKPGGEDAEGRLYDCKPAGATVNLLATGRVLYWNALEGGENIKAVQAAEVSKMINSQSRLLDLSGPTWMQPSPANGGANPGHYPDSARNFPMPMSSTDEGNDGSLFCADQNLLADGRVIAMGGTSWYDDPQLARVGKDRFGVPELEGIDSTRIYDPRTNTWTQSGRAKTGRWYPTLVTLGDGRQFMASGVRKLVAPVYHDRPAESGTLVERTETYDPRRGAWTDNGISARRTLPLIPRLHLLPNGHVFYNVAGQSFNPFGQSYDEAMWNVAATYDPATRTWRDLGVPGLSGGDDVQRRLEQLAAGDDYGHALDDFAGRGFPGGGRSFTIPGFRGSTFSIMLPLRPDANGRYTSASFLSAGGVLNPPSPGSYFATSDSRITKVDTAHGETMSTRATGDLTVPRWFGSGLLLPTGEVLVTSGSDRDEVDAPGMELPIRQAELFEPKTETWRPVATGHRPRTYHNTSLLLPDGRVLIGGHATIDTMYLKTIDVVPGVTAPNGHDPSFEIYTPPYLFRGARARVRKTPGRLSAGRSFRLTVRGNASHVASVVLVRNGSTTHLLDADQRSVELRIARRGAHVLRVLMPDSSNVVPPGPYLLFVNRGTARGPVPSVAKQVFVG